MVELKFTALKPNGQAITGTVTASSASEGKKKIQRLAEKTDLNLVTFRRNLHTYIGSAKEKKNQYKVSKRLLVKEK